MGEVKQRAFAAVDHILAGSSALARADVPAGEEAFANAATLIQSAEDQINQALSASRYILGALDVTGTVRSGQELLNAGEALAQAGQYVASGLKPLLAADGIVAGREATNSLIRSTQAHPSTPSLGSGRGQAESHRSLTLVQAIQAARDDAQRAASLLGDVSASLANVDGSFLPDEARGNLEIVRAAAPRARSLLSSFYNQSDTLLYLLGADHDRRYLMLFVNNHELRPVGGFIGTIGVMHVSAGRIASIQVQSVYDSDGQLRQFIAPPDPLLPIVDRWYLRDANWFVDYEMSAKKIAQLFEKEGGPTVDGVILLTPEVIKRLLTISGPVRVPGYEVEVSAQNFVEATQGEVTYRYDQAVNRPKQFLADLTPLLLNTLLGEAAKIDSHRQVLSALTSALQAKDMVMYFRDEAAQRTLKNLRWAGTLPREEQGFLTINNANIGGHKSDQFMEQEIDYRSEVQNDGDVEVVLTIRRTHHGPQEVSDYPYPANENPAYKDNIVYQRVLVPRGAQLIEARGFSHPGDVPAPAIKQTDIPWQADPDIALWQQGQQMMSNGTVVGQESGYTFFANWYITKPGQTAVALYRYRLPSHAPMPNFFKRAQTYSVYVAKQPGDARTELRASVKLPDAYRIIHRSTDEPVTQESDNEIIYQDRLRSDTYVGAVYEPAN